VKPTQGSSASSSGNAASTQGTPRSAPPPISGSGTTGYLAKWTSRTKLSNSALFQDTSGNVGVGITKPRRPLDVSKEIVATNRLTLAQDLSLTSKTWHLDNSQSLFRLFWQPNINTPGTVVLSANTAGAVGINTQTPTAQFEVDGSTGNAGVFIGANEGNVFTAGNGVTAIGGNGAIYSGGIGGNFLGGSSSAFAGGVGVAAKGGTGIFGEEYAGYFEGDVSVTGTIFAGTKDFKIDHPLDPANRYLYHASVESSEMMDIYSGNRDLDAHGEAAVQLPLWFQAVNGDFRYQLTSIGAPGAGLYIAEEISDNHFKIAGGKPGGKVSWQVTAVRRDAYAKAYPLIVEQAKNDRDRGYYIHPELYGAPEERGIERARHPRR
jgi:hypothetical protein